MLDLRGDVTVQRYWYIEGSPFSLNSPMCQSHHYITKQIKHRAYTRGLAVFPPKWLDIATFSPTNINNWRCSLQWPHQFIYQNLDFIMYIANFLLNNHFIPLSLEVFHKKNLKKYQKYCKKFFRVYDLFFWWNEDQCPIEFQIGYFIR